MSHSIYDKVLLKYIFSFSIIAFILFIIAIVCVIYTFRHLDKEAKIVISILLSVFLIVVSYFCFKNFPKYIYDIKNNTYITYTGDFTVSNKYTKGSAVFVYIDNYTQLESYSGISPGNYTGTVIYAKSSAIVLEVKFGENAEIGNKVRRSDGYTIF